MKKLLIICFALVQGMGFSQNQFSYNYTVNGLYSNYVNIQKESIKKNKIVAMQRFKLEEDNTKTLLEDEVLDTSSNLIFSTSNMNKKRIYQSSFTKYNSKSVYKRSYGKSYSMEVYDFVFLDSNKKHIDRKKYYYKNKLQNTTKMFRQGSGQLDSVFYFKKRNKNHSSKIVYKYQNGKVSETKYYSKGKLKRIQKFDCNPIGESIKKVKQTQQCKNTSFDENGNRITVVVTTDEKGRERKNKQTYLKDSKTMIKYESFNYKNHLTYYWEKQNGTEININYWGKKGNRSYKSITKYDEKDLVVSKEEYFNNKLNSSQVYNYNSIGLIEKEISTNRKGKKTTYIFTYKSK